MAIRQVFRQRLQAEKVSRDKFLMDCGDDGSPTREHIIACASRIAMTALDVLQSASTFTAEDRNHPHLIGYNDRRYRQKAVEFFQEFNIKFNDLLNTAQDYGLHLEEVADVVHCWVGEFRDSARARPAPSKSSLSQITFDNIAGIRVFLTDIFTIDDFLPDATSETIFVAHAPSYNMQSLRTLFKTASKIKVEAEIK